MFTLGRYAPLILIFFFAGSAQAALDEWGTEAWTSIADCSGSCTNFSFGPTMGGPGISNSGLSEISAPRGNAKASAVLAGDISSPILKAEAYANPNSHGAFATAFGVQGYTYTGIGETVVININLDGLVDDPESDAGDTSAFMEVVIYRPDNFAFIAHRPSLDFEFGAMPFQQSGGSEASVFLQLDYMNPTTDSGQISIDLANGDEFYLWALLRAEAEAGLSATSADAFNTGTISFAGDPLLEAAAPVPVPAALWLLGSALVGLVRFGSRH